MTAPDRSTLLELLAKLEAATGPNRELDDALMAIVYVRRDRHIGWFDDDDNPIVQPVWVVPETDKFVRTAPFEFTASIDAAVALVERVLPGAWYVLTRGKALPSDPLYRARIVFGADTSLGDGEHDTEQAIALLIALLKALVEKTHD